MAIRDTNGKGKDLGKGKGKDGGEATSSSSGIIRGKGRIGRDKGKGKWDPGKGKWDKDKGKPPVLVLCHPRSEAELGRLTLFLSNSGMHYECWERPRPPPLWGI